MPLRIKNSYKKRIWVAVRVAVAVTAITTTAVATATTAATMAFIILVQNALFWKKYVTKL